MCIIVWSLGSLKFLVTSWPPTVIIDIILAPIFVMLNGFPVTIFTVLQFPFLSTPLQLLVLFVSNLMLRSFSVFRFLASDVVLFLSLPGPVSLC